MEKQNIMSKDSSINGKTEIWKPVPDYEGLYEVSNYGNVKRLARERIITNGISKPLSEKLLKNFTGKFGYSHVNLYKNKKLKQHRVHRIVMLAFTHMPNNKTSFNHIDGNKSNNKLSNLEWCTQKENTIHAYKTGLAKGRPGEQNSNSKLTKKQVLEIRNLYTQGNWTHRELAQKYNISRRHVGDIINRKRWMWLE